MTIKLAATAFALALASTSGLASAAERLTVPLADGWRFTQDDALSGAEAPGFNDKSWAAVSVPHTWNRAGYYLSDGPHPHTPATINTKQGVGWYRLSFTRPPPSRGQGRLAAVRRRQPHRQGLAQRRPSGRTPGRLLRFRLDATDALRPAARTCWSSAPTTASPRRAPTADNLPLTGDFFVHGGLYRLSAWSPPNPAHFDMLDFGGPGVYAQTTAISAARPRSRCARSCATTRPRGARLADQALSMSRGVAAQASAPSPCPPGKRPGGPSLALALADPHLWNGVKPTPTSTGWNRSGRRDGKVLDRVDDAVRRAPDPLRSRKGFLLNGKPTACTAWAITRTAKARAGRSAPPTPRGHGDPAGDGRQHHPPDPLPAWPDHPRSGRQVRLRPVGRNPAGVMAWTPTSVEPTPGLVENARQQLQELIRQNYNHASVAVWGIANEVDLATRSRPS
jgi:beta-galactosidase